MANASYVAQATSLAGAETVLLRTNQDARFVALEVQNVTQSIPGLQVSDIGSAQKAISSNLTAINLRGLTALELIFAVILAAGASGLILALGFAERRKSFATLLVLGANPKQLGVFVWTEGLTILVGGVFFGLTAGVGLAQLLVQILTHVFDPPPETLVIPGVYLMVLMAAFLGATVLAVIGAITAARRAGVAVLRTL